MWWFVGLVFSGWLTWVLWTHQTHLVTDVFTIPGSIFHLYHYWRQRGGRRLPIMYATDLLAGDLFDTSIILAAIALTAFCSWNFFAGHHHPAMVFAGAWYLSLIVAKTLFLDITTKT